LLAVAGDLEFLASLNSLEAATQLVTAGPPDVVVVDKGFGMRIVLDWIHDLKLLEARPAVVVWGVFMTEPEVLHLLLAGAKGIVSKTAGLESILICLRTVASGQSWTEDCEHHHSPWPVLTPRAHYDSPGPALTPREHQVAEMVEQGLKNNDIALELGISPGTVKIHLKHVIEKTGARGRYDLAISGLKKRGSLSMVS
jgi:two-component system, NarL family, nitrate/nitrite response regulator NarL